MLSGSTVNGNTLIEKIGSRSAIIGIIGLGYVGLPLAMQVVKSGYRTIGFDIEKNRINIINKIRENDYQNNGETFEGFIEKNIFEVTTDFLLLKDVDIVCICVPTPLDIYQQPDLSYVKESVTNIANNLHSGMLIILESTTYPGTTEEMVKSQLEYISGMKCGEEFFLAFSPERIDPGNKKYNVKNIPKIVGGIDDISTKITKIFYQSILESEVYTVSSPRVAEMTKIYENIFRNVNIALVNEMAILCHKMNINIWEVIEAAKTKPYGFMPFYPGPGIGGHCIPLDPFYLTWKAREYNYHTKFIELAGEINRYMPEYTVERIAKILSKKFKKSLNGAKILLIGVAYKKDIDDIRESPSLEIIKKLEEENSLISYYDPYIMSFTFKEREYTGLQKITAEEIRSQDMVVIATDHTAIDYDLIIQNAKVVFDTRNIIKEKKDNIEKL
ncbi:MAG: nucleotide sugar dehydrogenase [Candidatus Atribacteria bacterium]|nr:nucleotide sugar dehydrogenase [Candidatus Atribacteria bacterium]